MTFRILATIVPPLWRSQTEANVLSLIQEATGRRILYWASLNGLRCRPDEAITTEEVAQAWFRGLVVLYQR